MPDKDALRAAALANPEFAGRRWQKGQSANPTGGRQGTAEKKLRVNEPPFTHLRKQKFLAEFRRSRNLTTAAKWAGVSRGTVTRTRVEDHEFDELIKEIQLEHSDAVEAEMFRRAIEGDNSPTGFKDKAGNPVYRKQYDQRAAETVLARYKPEFKAGLKAIGEAPGAKQPVELANARSTVARELDRIAERLTGGKTRSIAAKRKGGDPGKTESE
jgi:hypothetical protein